MVKISVQHEDFNFYRDKIENFEDFKNQHESNIENFKEVVSDVLSKKEGKYVFDYVIKYHQFDPLDGQEDISAEHVAKIEEKYPNCFI